jgi:drug/metabolite transporter (DMT)-like permease
METRRSAAVAIGCSLLYVVFISSAFVTIKIGVSYCPPLTLLAIRYVLAGLLMFGLVRVARVPWPTSRQTWVRLGLLGVLQWLLPAALNFVALRRASAGMGAILYATNPLLIAVLGVRVLGERLTGQRIVGLLLGFGGVVLVMISRVGSGRRDTPLGVLLLSLSVLGMAVGTLLFKRYPPRESLLVVNAIQAILSAIVLLPIALVLERPGDATLNLPVVLATLHLTLLVTIAAPLIWYWLLRHGEVSTASSFLFLTPLFGVGLAVLLLHEKFSFRDGIGFVAAALGIVLIRRR